MSKLVKVRVLSTKKVWNMNILIAVFLVDKPQRVFLQQILAWINSTEDASSRVF